MDAHFISSNSSLIHTDITQPSPYLTLNKKHLFITASIKKHCNVPTKIFAHELASY
ncbi:hypothetical protein SAMN05216325_11895 [Nitrosomonas marina]|uniref:Uncharacterized protein n=1 Tax=Nitrosomonas marina TaxID=917 RepID=A0A1H8GLD6_9PROT|nr:hypothetical protein SAMN05216325_11895 [Nitrosomonas marina]